MEPEQALVGMCGEGHWLALAQWLVTLPAHPPRWQFTISSTTVHPHWPPPRTPVSFLSLGIRLPLWMASWAHLLLHPHCAARDSERWRCTWAVSHTCAPYPVPFLLPGAPLWTGQVITQLRQEGERDTVILQWRFPNAISPAQEINHGMKSQVLAVRIQTVLSPLLNPARFSSHVRTVLPLQSFTCHLLFEDVTLSSYLQTEYSLRPRLGGRHLASHVRDLSGSSWACSKDGSMAGPYRGAMASVALH